MPNKSVGVSNVCARSRDLRQNSLTSRPEWTQARFVLYVTLAEKNAYKTSGTIDSAIKVGVLRPDSGMEEMSETPTTEAEGAQPEVLQGHCKVSDK